MSDHVITLSSGRKLGYAEYGDPAGVPLFYFHGWPSSRLQGELLDPIGRRRGIRVIAPDRPGIGLSDVQPGRMLLDWPPVLRELAAHLGWKDFHVMGVSGGGPYVLACAHAMPQRLLSAGVLCGAPPLREVGTKELLWTYRLGLWGQRYTPFFLSPGLAVAGRAMLMPQDSLIMRAFIRTLCERDQLAMRTPELYRILMASGRVAVRSGARNASIDGKIYSSDWGIDFSRVDFPVRFWHGGMDRNIPSTLAAKFVKKIPQARLEVLESDGHYSLPMLRNEEIIGELLGWK